MWLPAMKKSQARFASARCATLGRYVESSLALAAGLATAQQKALFQVALALGISATPP
jgi:hypothetical protein